MKLDKFGKYLIGGAAIGLMGIIGIFVGIDSSKQHLIRGGGSGGSHGHSSSSSSSSSHGHSSSSSSSSSHGHSSSSSSHGHSSSSSSSHSHSSSSSSTSSSTTTTVVESKPFVCNQLFSDAVQLHSLDTSDEIVFHCNAQVIDNPDTTLNALSINNPSGSCLSTCQTADCSPSGIPASTIDATFQTTSATCGTASTSSTSSSSSSSHGHSGGHGGGAAGSHGHSSSSSSSCTGTGDVTISGSSTLGSDGTVDFYDVTVSNSSTLTFASQSGSTVYRMHKLQIGQGSVVNFVPGDYYIEDFDAHQGTVLNVVGSGTVRLFLLENGEFKQGMTVNGNTTETNPSKNFFVYGFADIDIKQGTAFNGFVYSKQKVTLHQSTAITGGILADEIELKNSATVTYDSVAAATIDYGDLCPEGVISHFEVEHDNEGTACTPFHVTVTAKDAMGGTVTNYTGTMQLDTGIGKGTWELVTGNGSFSDATADDGLATYTFSASDQGVAVFGLVYVGPDATIDVEVEDTSNSKIRDDDSSGTITFTATGFIFTAEAISDPVTTTPSTFNSSLTAGIPSTVYVTAYGLSGTSACGVVTTYDGTKPVNFWQDYVDPGTGTLTMFVDESNITSSEDSATTQNVVFSNGQASVTILYRDVGKLKLYIKDPAIANMRGATGDFVVKPAKFSVSIPSNPGATSGADGVFKKAGESFTCSVTVQDNDGNTTPNYGNESTPESVRIYSSMLVLPGGGRNGTLSDGSITTSDTFSKVASGQFTSTSCAFDEVGIIKLTAGVASENYLGAGDVTGPETGNVGRFTPDRFDATGNTPSFDAGCVSGGFTYLGQKFTYSTAPEITVTALNVAGTVTQNYTGEFWKMSSSLVLPSYSSSGSSNLSTAVAELDVSASEVGAGVSTIALGDGSGISFYKGTGTNTAPFTAEIQAESTVSDTDGITYAGNPYTFGGTGTGSGISFNGGKAIYQGRMKLDNTFGSELLPLTVPLTIQYFNGTQYITSVADSCSSVSSSNISTSSEPSSLDTSVTMGVISGGIGTITLSTPSPSGTTGYVDLEVDLSATGANLPHLQHDWPHDDNADGNYNDNPVARATFGIYKGEEKVIYIKEVH